LLEGIYSRIETIIEENSNDESLNLNKRLKNNESILKILKGKPLLEMQECIHIANDIFKNANLNSTSKECRITVKMSFYEILGKIQNLEGQTINIVETNLENTVCTLIESLKEDNLHKANYSKDKVNNLLNKLVDSAKKLSIKDDATSIEVWLFIVQSSINTNNYSIALLCINNCFSHYTCIYNDDINLKDSINNNFCRYWTIRALLQYNDLIKTMIENKIFYEKEVDMYIDALKYCIYSLINIRYLSNLITPIYKEVFYRIWNNIVELIKHKEIYSTLQKYIEIIVEEINIINTQKTESKNVFIYYSNELIPMFIKIVETLYNLSKYNKSKENSKTIIERAFRGFPTQFHKETLELRLRYYYNNENGLVSGAIHELDNFKQSDLWFSFSTIESYGHQKCYLALQNSIRLSENSLAKAEKMILYADWMYKNNYNDDEINSVLITTSLLLDNVFENKDIENDIDENSINNCSLEQLELIIKMYCIRILVQNSKTKIINMIKCCGYYIKYIAKKTFNEFLQESYIDNPPVPKKKDKDGEHAEKNKKKESKSKEKENKTKENKNKENINITSRDKEKEKEKEKAKISAFIAEKSSLFPSTEKEWLKFLWPSLIVDYIFSYKGEHDILCINNLNNGIYLISACINIVLESIKIECYSYSLPFLWFSYYLTTYWLSGVDKAKSLCLIYSLYTYFGEKLEFDDIYTDNYIKFKEELTNIDFNLLDNGGYKKNNKMLSVCNDIPFDIRAVYLEIANIYILLNKDMWEIHYILKNIIINDNFDDKLKSKFYFYTNLSQFYLSNNYDECISIAEKTISLNCSSLEKMKSVILLLWSLIRKNKLYKFLEGDTKKEIQNYLNKTNNNRYSSQYFNGHLYHYSVLTYIRVVDEIKTDELFNEIFTYIENAESIFKNQEDYVSLIKCYITHANIYLKYVKYNMKKPKESFIQSIECIDKAEKVMNNLLNIYSNTIDETLLKKHLQMSILETKTYIYRKSYSFVDPIIDSKDIVNDNVINNYLLTVDIDKKINYKWKILQNSIINEILRYYKLYINQEYKTSVFLYNCSNCFSVYVKSKKAILPPIISKDRRSFSKDTKSLYHKRGSVMIPLMNNEYALKKRDYKNIDELTEIDSKFLINIYKDIINYSINENEYGILRKASEELFYFYCDNNENASVPKFM